MSERVSQVRGVLAIPSLAEVLEDPARVEELPAEAARALLVRLMALQPLLVTRALAGPTTAADRLLTPGEAAAKLGQSLSWVYKHAATLPFTVRNGRALRFSEASLEAWIRRQQRR